MKLPASDASRASVPATSSGRPKRRINMPARVFSWMAGSSVSVIPVSIEPGAMALTRMLCLAHWAARSLVR